MTQYETQKLYEEKAFYLVQKMLLTQGSLTYEAAQKAAIVVVDEILNNIEATMLYIKDSEALKLNLEYWVGVKSAI